MYHKDLHTSMLSWVDAVMLELGHNVVWLCSQASRKGNINLMDGIAALPVALNATGLRQSWSHSVLVEGTPKVGVKYFGNPFRCPGSTLRFKLQAQIRFVG